MDKKIIFIFLLVVYSATITGMFYQDSTSTTKEQQLRKGIITGFYYGLVYQLDTQVINKSVLDNAINETNQLEIDNLLSCHKTLISNNITDTSYFSDCLDLALIDSKRGR